MKDTTKHYDVEILAPDTSVIIDGILSLWINTGRITLKTLLIHEAAVAEIEHQANEDKAIGYLGITELLKLKELSNTKHFEMQFSGMKPRQGDIEHAHLGDIDAMIRDIAYENSATLFTSDKIQSRIAEAKGMQVIYVEKEQNMQKIALEQFFDDTTMSVHLRENVFPYAKKGVPGNWQLIAVRDTLLTREEIQDISTEIIEAAGTKKNAFVEIERPGSTIVQLQKFRIVITKPPFSDGWEITAVRPVKTMSLDDYKLSEKLLARISEQAEGILIAGAPGMGKSTFAQALAIHYASNNKVVKTVEAPRDLILPENITQYAISHGSSQEIHDILLLSRPDYTIFDEMRNTDDFRLFADLRLAGIGLAGVVHATNPVDAIQRFVGRIELGVIPQIIDTVIFIKNGTVFKTLNLQMVVKVPSGMTEADLARPVVVVTDFETKKIEYELYSYGEETVVIPVTTTEKSPSRGLAEQAIKDVFREYSNKVDVELVSDRKCIVRVPETDIARIIGKQGSNINKIESKLGLSIEVEAASQKDFTEKEMIPFSTEITKKNIVFSVNNSVVNQRVDICVGEDYLLSANIGKDGIVKINKKNKIGKILSDAVNYGEKITLKTAK